MSTKNNAIYEGKKFWCGSASMLDGAIEEVHTCTEAENADWHHSLYFSIPQVEKIDAGENTFFYVDEQGNIQTCWRQEEAPAHIIAAIRAQIFTVNKRS